LRSRDGLPGPGEMRHEPRARAPDRACAGCITSRHLACITHGNGRCVRNGCGAQSLMAQGVERGMRHQAEHEAEHGRNHGANHPPGRPRRGAAAVAAHHSQNLLNIMSPR
jgi:hypothetical protein